MKQYDTVIIGSGLGGLSCGATLAKAGKKVLVLEQHSLIGGCATCFKRKGANVDVGLHEMDYGNPKTDMKHYLFEKLGVKDKIKIIPLPTAWSISVLDKEGKEVESLTIPHNQEETKKALKKRFPHESQGIDAYFKAINLEAYAARRLPWDMGFWDFFFFPITTLWIHIKNRIKNPKVAEMMNQMMQDDKLKRILNINMPYYHHDVSKFIWSFHAIPQKHYYDQGIYVKGGSQSISNAFQAVIEENGGEVQARCDVTEILTENNRAVGVKYFDKKEKVEKSVYAQNIVANCDPHIVYEDLLKTKGLDLSADINHYKDKPAAVSLVSGYLVFDKNLSELYPEMDYSTFIVSEEYFNAPFSQGNFLEIGLLDRPFVFVNYSKIDSGLSERDDRFVGVLTTASTLEEWNHLSEEEYKAQKEQILQKMLQALEAKFPNLTQHLIHSELSTPKTIQRYIRTKSGSAYGFSQDKDDPSYRLGWKSKSVKNLYFASAFGSPGGGFTGAIIGGYRTGSLMLNPYAMLKRVALCFVVGTGLGIGITFLLKALL